MLLTIFEQKKNMTKFSVVFMPDYQTIELIKQLKINLSKEIGSYKSKNSLAHFTIYEFHEEDSHEELFLSQLERIASEIEPFEIICDSFDFYENGAFYIKPDHASASRMSVLMKQIIKESTRIKKQHTTTTPHITIGRKLNPKELKTANKLFTDIFLKFSIDSLILRKYEPNVGQYTVYKKLPFLGKSKHIQGSLF